MKHPAGIWLDCVSRHYWTPSGTVAALDAVSMDVDSGSSVAIVGPSGCGKSTLLSLIGGLDAPTTGRIVVGDLELSGLPEPDRDRVRREDFGFVFQADNLLPYLTAAENVALQLALHGTADGTGRIPSLLARLGVAECAEKLPDQLSGGQRVRVGIARALVHRPTVILADEPTGSVDADNAEIIVDLLLAAQRSTGATLVMVTHDLDVARRLDRTIGLRAGRLAGPDPSGQ
jgi:putative ABC transport system ATP-binding protein